MYKRTGPGWRLLHATYQETLAVCAAEGGADLIAFSPPYCDARTYGADVSWTDADYAALGDAVFPALKPGGHALVNVDAPVRAWRSICELCGRMAPQGATACPSCGGALVSGPTERGFHPWRMMLDWGERIGFRVPDRLAFGRLGLPGEYKGRFRNDWEPLLWFTKGEPAYFDRTGLVTAAKDPARAKGKFTRFGAERGRGARIGSGWAAEQSVAHRGTAWNYGHQGGGQTGAPDIEAQNHPARWPFRLAEDLVRCFCPPDGLVCDPFSGAGTTGAAAIAHGRRFLGGDLYARTDDGKRWVDVAADVLTDRQRQVRLFR